MSYLIHFTSFANNDIDNILKYISQDSPDNAIKTIDNLEERINNILGVFPYSWTSYLDFQYFSFNNYIVIYDVDEENKTVYILMIVESHQKWREIFNERI